jgi:RNA polymerase sigma factor (sigma-70 family)
VKLLLVLWALSHLSSFFSKVATLRDVLLENGPLGRGAIVTEDQGSSGEVRTIEPQTLEEAVSHFQRPLLRYASRVLSNEEAAKDVVQEAFIKLYRHWDKLKRRGTPVKGWLYRTTHNAAVDYIRKESRRRSLHQRQTEQSEPARVVPEEMDERLAMVLARLDMLKPKEREVLILRMQEEMSYREIAAVLKRSEGYVGSLIHEATKKVSQSLRNAGILE